jgi:hypothetical protein
MEKRRRYRPMIGRKVVTSAVLLRDISESDDFTMF